jgi:hypothetical protein
VNRKLTSSSGRACQNVVCDRERQARYALYYTWFFNTNM